jgi:hypothetical protein
MDCINYSLKGKQYPSGTLIILKINQLFMIMYESLLLFYNIRQIIYMKSWDKCSTFTFEADPEVKSEEGFGGLIMSSWGSSWLFSSIITS